MKELTMNTFDGKKMHVSLWDEVTDVKACVVISHGMSEHTARYDNFANFLNENGFIVLADDHRGHKFNNAGEKGMVDGNSFEQTVEDMRTVVDYAKETYGKEVFLIGHSYGSFLSQRFVELYSKKIKACILSGTAMMKNPLVFMGNMIAETQKFFLGPNKIGYLIDKMSFGNYNKPFVSQGQQFAWLSRDKKVVAKYEADEYCGYPLSIGFYTSFFSSVLKMYGKNLKNVAKDFPIMIAVGSDDPVSNKTVLAKKLFDEYQKRGLEAVTMKVYDGARHEILNETNRSEVYKDMLDFLNGNL